MRRLSELRALQCVAVVNKGLEPKWFKVAGQTLNKAFRQADMRTAAFKTLLGNTHRLEVFIDWRAHERTAMIITKLIRPIPDNVE